MVGDFKPKVDVTIQPPLALKAEIKAEIPSESSGRLVDALTDIIRPFTEKRGLRADQIRLQREEVLIEIARRARDRLRIEGRHPNALPNKFLIPFLEKASFEEVESDLVELWSNLLVSAAIGYDTIYMRFSAVLAELGIKEVKMLDRICTSARREGANSSIEDAPIKFQSDIYFTSFWKNLAAVLLESPAQEVKAADISHLMDEFIADTEVGGLIIQHVYFSPDLEQNVVDDRNCHIGELEVEHPLFPPNVWEDEVAIAALQNAGLIESGVRSSPIEEVSAFVSFIHLTRFGLEFYLACNPALAHEIDLKGAAEGLPPRRRRNERKGLE